MFKLEEDNSRITPQEDIQSYGNNATFQCKSGGPSRWFVNSLTDLIPNSGRSNPLWVKSVSYSDSGTYYCYGSYYDTNETFLAKANLIVVCKLPHLFQAEFIK